MDYGFVPKKINIKTNKVSKNAKNVKSRLEYTFPLLFDYENLNTLRNIWKEPVFIVSLQQYIDTLWQVKVFFFAQNSLSHPLHAIHKQSWICYSTLAEFHSIWVKVHVLM
jgi:hypothetical protein